MQKKPSNKIVILGVLSTLTICCSFLYIALTIFETNAFADTTTYVIPHRTPKPDYFKDVSVQANSVIVYDVKNNKILYQKNATTSLPLASITKVMTAVVAEDVLQPSQIIPIDKSSLDIEGENGLKENQSWKFSDLLKFTLLVSSNDGAHAIATVASATKGVSFPEQMNTKAKELGLTSMNFNNESGLDIDDTGISGGYGSAEDVAKLFAHVITEDPHLLEVTRNDAYNFRALDDTLYEADNTDVIVDKIPGMIASKTGYTALAGGNLAVAFDAGLNHPIVIVVLGSTFDGRFSDVLTLASSTLKSL